MTREDKMKHWQERLQHQKDSQLTIAAGANCTKLPNARAFVLVS